MKIGIFTFFQTNYGAVLQAYALQKYLEQLQGVEAEIIDFTTDAHLKGHKLIKKYPGRNLIKACVYYFQSFYYYKQLKQRSQRTQDFKDKYFHFTRRYSTVEDIINNHPYEDIYLTGSDQVFNPNTPYCPVYYLDFDKHEGKKVAYAPSFGISSFNETIANKIKKYLDDFDSLSCRERAGANFLSSMLEKNIPVVIDPVFLHDAKAWGELAVKPKYKKDYIFIYDLNGGKNLIKIAKKIQAKTHLPIICLTANRLNIYPVQKQIYGAGPAEFIGLIENANYVVTDSFHGTAFSVIFKKDFFTYIAIEETSSRITGLLAEAGLIDRIVRKQNLNEFCFNNNEHCPVPHLEEFIRNSKDYILSALS